MCELFGMSASHVTDVNHSLALLMPRGGEIGPHADGWGVAFYEGRAARIFKEPVPAAESRCLAFITEYDFQSTTVIAHIRKANPEKIGRATANTHPFEREWNGRSWVFAHNGKLPGLRADRAFNVNRFRPMGETDSEYAFCLLLEAIVTSSVAKGSMLTANNLVEIVKPLVEKLTTFGEFNFMLSDGVNLIVHAHTNLHTLRRTCDDSGCAQEVVLFATSPLTNERWVQLENGSIHVYRNGMETTSTASSKPTHITPISASAPAS